MIPDVPLSEREEQVFQLVLQGKSNKQIAWLLGISLRTVEFHLKNVYAKFQVSSRVELLLKLGQTTGSLHSTELGYSTVERPGEKAENGDRLNPRMGWATFREAVSVIGQELIMKAIPNKPSAFLPLAMFFGALAMVLMYVLIFGLAQQFGIGLPGAVKAGEVGEPFTAQGSDTVTICHKAGTRAEKTLAVPHEDLADHFSHGDGIGACIPGGAVYVISGGPNQDAGIFVDDILRVFLNGNLIFEGSQGGRCCTPLDPIRFAGTSGDTLQVQAQDANACYSLEALWLQKADGSSLTQLTGDIFGPNCGSEPPEQIFFDQTFTLP